MQFQVPQFIETEDKIIGPLTLLQFLYIGGAGIIVAVLFFVLNFSLWIVTAIFFGGVGVGLAFGKVNGRPITIYLTALIDSIWKPKVYVYKPAFTAQKETRDISRRAVETNRISRPESQKTLEEPDRLDTQKPIEHTAAQPTTISQLKKQEKTSIISRREQRQRHKLKAPSFGGIQGLRNWLATSKTAIPRRERPLPRNFGKPQREFKDKYSVVRHFTGERELAKRVDYR